MQQETEFMKGIDATEQIRGVASALSELDDWHYKMLLREPWFRDLQVANRAIQRWRTACSVVRP